MKELAIGIDIGGTYTKYGIIDQTGKLYAKGNTKTDVYKNVDDYISNLINCLKKSEEKINEPYKIVGIGIGAPNGNYHKGTIENATNLNWKGNINLVNIFNKFYDVPAKLTNDANAAALGEMIYGKAKGMLDFVMITLGTGLGAGIIANGKLVYGHDGFAGELGHLMVKKNGRKCGCGNYGCLESYVSVSGIKRTVFELLSIDTQNSELTNYNYNELNSEIIFEAAKKNDPIALKAFECTGKILGAKLAETVLHTSPEAIFVSGGLAKSGNLIIKPTQESMEENLMPSFRNKVKILKSSLMDKNAAILGTAALVWNKNGK